ncbi:MAG: LptF/LptG family permease [Deltaproteobacteria bacterium]|jgi:lipopolysaccharide export system permease protein|nr:LptF/LptG family permease [Deltaproteobacteria bacterium]
MRLLFRLLIRNNALLLLPALLAGAGIYILTDLFERLDNFIDAQLGAKTILVYFVYKLPLIISQILPVVFLLATVIQLCLMMRSRETTALYAGGISPLTILRILFVSGMLWSAVQFGFSQWLGAEGEQQSMRIWLEQVRKRNISHTVLTNVWFTENAWIVSLGTLHPDNTGNDLQACKLSPDALRVEELILARHYAANPDAWQLSEVLRIYPDQFKREHFDTLPLPLRQDLESFRLVNVGSNLQQLSVAQLGQAIDALRASGSNVEALRTAWHGKIAYAASLAVMSLVAMAIAVWKENVYIAAGLALLTTFLYYAVYTVANTLGQQGVLPPFLAAWLANFVAAGIALFRLAPIILPGRPNTRPSLFEDVHDAEV